MRLAIFSDVHANLPALDGAKRAEAILASDLPDEFADEVREARGLQAPATSAAR